MPKRVRFCYLKAAHLSVAVVTAAGVTACFDNTPADQPSAADVSDVEVIKIKNKAVRPLEHRKQTQLDAKDTDLSAAQDSGDTDSWQPARVKQVEAVGVTRDPKVVAAEVARAVELSQARLAANSRDICPKLLTRAVDSNVIIRNKELLRGQHCDYYIFLQEGELLRVKSVPKTLQARLIMPTLHNFEDGPYQVEQNIRHDIRINYVGSTVRKSPINYGVAVITD